MVERNVGYGKTRLVWVDAGTVFFAKRKKKSTRLAGIFFWKNKEMNSICVSGNGDGDVVLFFNWLFSPVAVFYAMHIPNSV